MTTTSKQAAINVDLFTTLPIGAFFEVLAKGTRRLIGRYTKLDQDRVESIGDNRVWPFAFTEGSGSHTELRVEQWSV